MSKTYPGVPEGTKIDPLTYDDDVRVADLDLVTIERPEGGAPSAIWVAGINLHLKEADDVALAAAILRGYQAGNAQPPTDDDRRERRAQEIARANAGVDPADMRRAAEILESGR